MAECGYFKRFLGSKPGVNGVQPHFAVKFNVLRGVKDVESRGPEDDAHSQNNGAISIEPVTAIQPAMGAAFYMDRKRNATLM
jgi:hypothetical protein